jgi:pimeloyl-ACP methyl ester carboxylesterase
MNGPPMPPALPPGRVLNLPGRGEVFFRDSGGTPASPVVLLLHGWTVSADLNFFPAYACLAESYRVIAPDQRGHGRGMRSLERFRLEDCADDAAALLEQLGVSRVVVVGYSMGGPVGLLLARRHPGKVTALVLQATALEWRHTARERAVWRLLPLLDLSVRIGVGNGLADRVIAKEPVKLPSSAATGPGWPRSSSARRRATWSPRDARLAVTTPARGRDNWASRPRCSSPPGTAWSGRQSSMSWRRRCAPGSSRSTRITTCRWREATSTPA